jgi:hypothetical protein
MTGGTLPPVMAGLLASYLDTLDSPQRWALLGLNATNRRRSVEGQKNSAVLAFADAVKAGLDVQAATVAAYDAYFASAPAQSGRAPATYATDSKKPGIRGMTKAEQRMASTVRPTLVRFGVLSAQRPGRPKKQK